uniref:Uncharacterized protein n=1 Tax=Chromera velia CCMP2878 TaxID=1169474 RepID=A0A0G4FWR7_9ALVE|eukprot:Cvel_19060.t1-p1 / transcript=Cvel_19060.t1 / gene=Cvel_19060 / organism=Chromera_velia_CCMP2878 / gene_product=hypothetical protein / transcript_product=hypothetical protein / location=Cvel_scaffold1616:33268-33834(-) / protein_length=189 / sequence_SO=supercontig / SO=protein_coding / is_pseudo=false
MDVLRCLEGLVWCQRGALMLRQPGLCSPTLSRCLQAVCVWKEGVRGLLPLGSLEKRQKGGWRFLRSWNARPSLFGVASLVSVRRFHVEATRILVPYPLWQAVCVWKEGGKEGVRGLLPLGSLEKRQEGDWRFLRSWNGCPSLFGAASLVSVRRFLVEATRTLLPYPLALLAGSVCVEGGGKGVVAFGQS